MATPTSHFSRAAAPLLNCHALALRPEFWTLCTTCLPGPGCVHSKGLHLRTGFLETSVLQTS